MFCVSMQKKGFKQLFIQFLQNNHKKIVKYRNLKFLNLEDFIIILYNCYVLIGGYYEIYKRCRKHVLRKKRC